MNLLIFIDSCLHSPTTITIFQFPELDVAQTVLSPFIDVNVNFYEIRSSRDLNACMYAKKP